METWWTHWFFIFKICRKISNQKTRTGTRQKNTSGLLVIAKWKRHDCTGQRIFRPDHRKYSALVGEILKETGTIIGNVGRSLKDRKIMDVFPSGTWQTFTHYKVVSVLATLLIECKLETGRTSSDSCAYEICRSSNFSTMKLTEKQNPERHHIYALKQFIDNSFELLPRQALHAQTGYSSDNKKNVFECHLPERFFQRYRKVEKLRGT